ncbi:hypothetical protein Q5384_20380 [Enterobacter ludwigii]|uniref:hypothetical protein n=1 Tax=Enterobacter ludwigii TaxID=299767 RepID=UPI002B4BDA11|nr:hypothetical protein [Enterobacter ludwigii]WRM04113.1 hypothetical protein Q5384_20380 [Enterobacter ludwigii]
MTDNTRLNIRTKDMRACRFYFHYIHANIPESRAHVFDGNNPDVIRSCRIINDALEAYFPTYQDRLIFIRRMELALSTTILAERNFTWLENDTRATFWLWGRVCLDPECNQSISQVLNNMAYFSWYKESGLTLSPTSHHERLAALIAFVDHLCIRTNNAPAVRSWLTQSLDVWRKYAIRLIRFKWLTPDDADNCVWAYHSLVKYQQDFISESDNPLCPVILPSPVNAEEAFHTCYALLDLWEINNKTQQETIRKLNKAFYQKTFRKKQAARKGRDTLSEEHAGKLAFLVDYYRSDNTSVLEMLIDDRYRGLETRINVRQSFHRRP